MIEHPPSGPPIDVSVTIRPRMPIEGNPGVAIDLAQSLERGDGANVSRLELGAHTGTHVDAPRHFLPDGSGAEALIGHGVRLVGIDYLSIGDRDAHVASLGEGVGVLEGLDLQEVEPGAYFMACLPLKIDGSDGAPARAVLWRLGR
jgi:kynurenine formamidase